MLKNSEHYRYSKIDVFYSNLADKINNTSTRCDNIESKVVLKLYHETSY